MTSSKTPESAKITQDRATTTEKRQLDKELIRARLAALQKKHADAQARHEGRMASIGKNEAYGQKNSEANEFEAKDFAGKKFEGKKSDAKSFDNISIGRENRADYLEKLAKVKAEKGLEGGGKVEGVKQGTKKEVQGAPVSTNLTPTTARGEDHWGFPIPDSDSEDDEEDDDDSDDFDDEIRYGQATGSGWL